MEVIRVAMTQREGEKHVNFSYWYFVLSSTVAKTIFFRFIPANLELMFSKYAREVPDKLTMWELWHMTQANSVAYDFFGW